MNHQGLEELLQLQVEELKDAEVVVQGQLLQQLLMLEILHGLRLLEHPVEVSQLVGLGAQGDLQDVQRGQQELLLVEELQVDEAANYSRRRTKESEQRCLSSLLSLKIG